MPKCVSNYQTLFYLQSVIKQITRNIVNTTDLYWRWYRERVDIKKSADKLFEKKSDKEDKKSKKPSKK